MPFVILLFAAIFLVTGVRGTQSEFLGQLKQDVLGDKSFVYFIGSIVAIGSVGYIPQARKLSVAFMILIFVVLILANGDVFTRLTQQIDAAVAANRRQ